jgi:hypothetical protein
VAHVLLDERVLELLADQTLGVIDGVGGVLGNLVLGCISDQTLLVSESDITWCGVITLVIRDNFDVVVSENCNATLGCS